MQFHANYRAIVIFDVVYYYYCNVSRQMKEKTEEIFQETYGLLEMIDRV